MSNQTPLCTLRTLARRVGPRLSHSHVSHCIHGPATTAAVTTTAATAPLPSCRALSLRPSKPHHRSPCSANHPVKLFSSSLVSSDMDPSYQPNTIHVRHRQCVCTISLYNKHIPLQTSERVALIASLSQSAHSHTTHTTTTTGTGTGTGTTTTTTTHILAPPVIMRFG
jgi:hypothetical protein